MARSLRYAAYSPALVALVLGLSIGPGAASSVDLTGTRLAGVRLGPHPVGVSIRSLVDPTRHINAVDAGVRVAVATWYPALSRGSAGKRAMTALDYQELQLGTADEADRRHYEDDQITAFCSWRHIGIVALTRDQAGHALRTGGIAVRDAPARAGAWPVVMILGGPYYLASTAETLASFGFVVVAPYRTDDQQNEVSVQGFPGYLENSIRDAEWAMQAQERSRRPPPRLFALGHGGGGLQALLLAMRNRNVSAVVNIDSGNFSSRTNARMLPFYSPRLLRVPYLHILRAETRKELDQYDDFTAMAFSRRIEVVLQDDAVRHHDLSDIGRAVAVPMRIRGDAQGVVEREYADVQETIVRFLQSQSTGSGEAAAALDTWMTSHDGASRHAVKVYPAVEPAPVVQQVIAALDASTPAMLRDAHGRDPGAPVFDADNLAKIVARAIAAPGPRTALDIVNVARELYPDDPRFLALKSEASLAAGDRAAALSAARDCAAVPPGTDWQVQATVARCAEEVSRLTKD